MQQTPNWIPALVHFVIGGFLIPFLFGWVASLVLSTLLLAGMAGTLVSLVVGVVALFIGVPISARLVQGYFVIENKESVVNLATIFAVIAGVLPLFSSFGAGLMGFLIGLVVLLIEVAVFYILSRSSFIG